MAYSHIKTYLFAACLIIMIVAAVAADDHDHDHDGHDDHAPGAHDDHGASTSLAPFPALIVVAAIATVYSLARIWTLIA